MADLSLTLERTIRVPPLRVFAAWTEPAHLVHWWGPAGVRCTGAAVDLRVGGAWHIDNTLPDGSVIRFAGVFERVERPALLEYTWTRPPDRHAERVRVTFEAVPAGTRVTVVHSRITDPQVHASHVEGWGGCLDGLVAHLGL